VPLHVAVDLAQPMPVAGGWGAVGAAMFCTLALALAAGSAAYARIVSRGASSIGLTKPLGVAAFCAFAIACAWAAPAVFSSDAYAYAAYGELLRDGANPYAHQLLPQGVPIFDAAIVQWGNPPPVCVYGPIFVAISAAVVSATATFGTAAALGGLRATSSAALIVCGLLAYAAYRGDRRERLTAAATIALNPAAIWCAAEGHNDALALAIVLAGTALARRGHPQIGAFLSACAGAVKLPAVIGTLPAAFAGGGLGAIAGVAAVLALSVPLFIGIATHMAPHAQYAPQASFQALLEPIARAIVRSGAIAEAIAWVLAACAAALLGWAAFHRLRRGDREGWLYLALAGWLLLPNPYPWYGIWLAALAAFAPGTRAAAVLLALSLASLLRYLPDAVYREAPAPIAWLGLLATLPFLLLLPRQASFGIINRSP
jgi:alpha-1,6-mannosyltransferase